MERRNFFYFYIYKNGVKQDGSGGTVNTLIIFTNSVAREIPGSVMKGA